MNWRTILVPVCLLVVSTAGCYLACYGGVAQAGTWIGQANLIVGSALGIGCLAGMVGCLMFFSDAPDDSWCFGPRAPLWSETRRVPKPPPGGTGASGPRESGPA